MVDQSASVSPSAREPHLPSISPWLVRGFTRYGRWFVSRNFHAVRLSKAGLPVPLPGEPLIVYLNHPSWWDPMIALVLATSYFPDRRHFAPIDAAALAKYRFFEKLGFFGIDPESRAGARRFLQVSRAVLRRADSVLWVTAEGVFRDPRRRPVRLRPGIAHLARRFERGAMMPLALELPFWNERYPEALARFGTPVMVGEQRRYSAKAWAGLLERHLQATQDALAEEAMQRDPSVFQTTLSGRTGIGGFYDLWRRTKALLTGRRFDPGHGDVVR
jgi:1-acyl-sn-glycerol-3-phosphate acyltransferase